MNTVKLSKILLASRKFSPNTCPQVWSLPPYSTQRLDYGTQGTRKVSAAEPFVRRGSDNTMVNRQMYASNENPTNILNTPTSHITTVIDFNDIRTSFASKSTKELIQGYLIFSLCSIRYLTANGPRLYDIVHRTFGATITNFFIKLTFFNYFCLGQSTEDIKPVIRRQLERNVNIMQDYAVEADVPKNMNQEQRYSPEIDSVIRFTVKEILTGVDVLVDQNPRGKVVIKLTSFCNPIQLQRGTQLLEQYYKLFETLTDTTGEAAASASISGNEFIEKIQQYFTLTDTEAREQFTSLDIKKDNHVDYEEWYLSLKTTDIIQLFKKYRLDKSCCFDEQDDKQMKFLQNNINQVMEYSLERKIPVMIDAEQSYLQPFIERIVCDFQFLFNQEHPIVWNTYQCYLRTSYNRIQMSLRRAKLLHYICGAKIVRGAYVEQEREIAQQKGVQSPIYDTYNEVGANYDKCAELIITNREHFHVVIASHNQKSIERTIQQMKELGIPSNDVSINFAQLYGMADQLTFNLAKSDYNAYKFSPFGTISGVTPYLIRRASENGAMFQKLQFERGLLLKEILRRFHLA